MEVTPTEFPSKKKDAPPSTEKVSVGRRFEDRSLEEYEKAGFSLVARNWRCSIGEVDLILRNRSGRLFVVEVRSRRTETHLPSQYLSRQKQMRLKRLALVLCQRFREAVVIELSEWVTDKQGIATHKRYRVD